MSGSARLARRTARDTNAYAQPRAHRERAPPTDEVSTNTSKPIVLKVPKRPIRVFPDFPSRAERRFDQAMKHPRSETKKPSAPRASHPHLSLASLVASLGAATEDEARTLVGNVSDEQLTREGSAVATQRVSDDALRVYSAAAAFFDTASESQRAAVLLAPAVLRIGAWAAHRGDEASRALARGHAERTTEHTAKLAAAESTVARTRAHRDQCAEALRGAIGGDAEALSRLSSALRPGASGQPEAGPDVALASMVSLGRELLAKGDAGVETRSGLFGLTKAALDAWEKAAEAGAEARRMVEAPRQARATQGEVDRWDGINLRIIDRVVGAFAAARGIDPSVPALGLVSLRVRVGTGTKRKAAAGETKAPTAEPAKAAPAEG